MATSHTDTTTAPSHDSNTSLTLFRESHGSDNTGVLKMLADSAGFWTPAIVVYFKWAFLFRPGFESLLTHRQLSGAHRSCLCSGCS